MTVRELYLIITVKDKSLKSKTVRVVFRHMTKQGSQDTHMDFKVILQAWTIPKRWARTLLILAVHCEQS